MLWKLNFPPWLLLVVAKTWCRRRKTLFHDSDSQIGDRHRADLPRLRVRVTLNGICEYDIHYIYYVHDTIIHILLDTLRMHTVHLNMLKTRTVYLDALKLKAVHLDTLKQQTAHFDALKVHFVELDTLKTHIVYLNSI